jgi:sugar lactone lactonase YvrE
MLYLGSKICSPSYRNKKMKVNPNIVSAVRRILDESEVPEPEEGSVFFVDGVEGVERRWFQVQRLDGVLTAVPVEWGNKANETNS